MGRVSVSFFVEPIYHNDFSWGKINHNQTKKLINLVQSTMVKGTPIAVNKLPRINGGANIENIIENKLNIANKLRSKIFFFFSFK